VKVDVGEERRGMRGWRTNTVCFCDCCEVAILHTTRPQRDLLGSGAHLEKVESGETKCTQKWDLVFWL